MHHCLMQAIVIRVSLAKITEELEEINWTNIIPLCHEQCHEHTHTLPPKQAQDQEEWGHVLSRWSTGSRQFNQPECSDRIALFFFFYFCMPQTPEPVPHPNLKGFNITLEINHSKRKFLQWHISLNLSQGWHFCFYKKCYIIHTDHPLALTASDSSVIDHWFVRLSWETR